MSLNSFLLKASAAAGLALAFSGCTQKADDSNAAPPTQVAVAKGGTAINATGNSKITVSSTAQTDATVTSENATAYAEGGTAIIANGSAKVFVNGEVTADSSVSTAVVHVSGDSSATINGCSITSSINQNGSAEVTQSGNCAGVTVNPAPSP